MAACGAGGEHRVGDQLGNRPANFDNLGLVAYAPNSDFSLIALDHPSSDFWDTVPRSVSEAIMAGRPPRPSTRQDS